MAWLGFSGAFVISDAWQPAAQLGKRALFKCYLEGEVSIYSFLQRMLSNVPTGAAVRCMGMGSWKVVLPVWSWRETFGLGLGKRWEWGRRSSALRAKSQVREASLKALRTQSALTTSFYFDTGAWLGVAPAVCSSAELISSHCLWGSASAAEGRWWWWWRSPGSWGAGLHRWAPPQLRELLPLCSPVILSRDVPPRLPFLDRISSWWRSSCRFPVEVTNAEIISLLAAAVKEW